ncbi:hypothetical protein L6R52_26910 [Myxococcota bacterium]|nr:hypothetical protein [Myxococcota bacterium]
MALGVGAFGCASAEDADLAVEGSLYALVEGIDGVSFFPPLGPGAPVSSSPFDAALLEDLVIVVDAEDASGVVEVARFDARTSPAVALVAERERYLVNIPAAAYITDPARTYRIRALLGQEELGASTLSARVFEVMAARPDLWIGAQVRIEGTYAVRTVRRGGTSRLHCSDGVQNKDETGVDCGGGCAACPTCDDGVQNQGEEGTDCGGPCATSCANCSDGIQNQGESWIDCGGPCAPCCTPATTPASSQWVYSFTNSHCLSGCRGTSCITTTAVGQAALYGAYYICGSYYSCTSPCNMTVENVTVDAAGAIRGTWVYHGNGYTNRGTYGVSPTYSQPTCPTGYRYDTAAATCVCEH